MARSARLQIDLEPDRSAELADGLARLGGEILASPTIRNSDRGQARLSESDYLRATDLRQRRYGRPTRCRAMPISAMSATGGITRRSQATGRAASALNVFGLRCVKAPAVVLVILLPRTRPRLTELDWSILSPRIRSRSQRTRSGWSAPGNRHVHQMTTGSSQTHNCAFPWSAPAAP